mmetsp:Transcript_20961/g.36087  ORF Transcript_20961/g.36087 Transcript_20961/m.36087 type:complete len:328 (+) Transcript_20961:77-1060(+)
MTLTLAFRHLIQSIHIRSGSQGWERFIRPLMTAAAANESSPLSIALFSLSSLMQQQQQRSPRLALHPAFPSSSLALLPLRATSLPSPSLRTSEAAWRLLASSFQLLANKYHLLETVRQASREWCALRTTKALHRASIAQKIKEVFGEDACSDVVSKEATKKFRKEWKRSLSMYTSSGYGYMNQFLRGQREKSSEIPNIEEEIHGTRQALRFLSKKKKPLTFSGKVYRGARRIRPSLARLRPGMIFVDKAFLSTSTNPTVCKNFMNSDSTGVHITLTSRTGVNVKDFSKHSKEEEVLFLPETRFLVESVERTEKVLFLHLKELKYQGK